VHLPVENLWKSTVQNHCVAHCCPEISLVVPEK